MRKSEPQSCESNRISIHSIRCATSSRSFHLTLFASIDFLPTSKSRTNAPTNNETHPQRIGTYQKDDLKKKKKNLYSTFKLFELLQQIYPYCIDSHKRSIKCGYHRPQRFSRQQHSLRSARTRSASIGPERLLLMSASYYFQPPLMNGTRRIIPCHCTDGCLNQKNKARNEELSSVYFPKHSR